MSIIFYAAIYFICWWVSLLAVLPIGVRTHADAGTVLEGSAESAPVKPHWRNKLIACTLIALLLTLGIRYMVESPDFSIQPLLRAIVPTDIRSQ